MLVFFLLVSFVFVFFHLKSNVSVTCCQFSLYIQIWSLINMYNQEASPLCVFVFSLPSHKNTYSANTKCTTRTFPGMFTFRADCSECIMLLPALLLYVSCTCEPCKQCSTLSPSPSLQCKCKSAGHTRLFVEKLSWVSVTLVEESFFFFFYTSISEKLEYCW